MKQLAMIACLCLCVSNLTAGETEGHWPQWRGPDGTGVAKNANPPVEWSEKKNVRWKVDLPGLGHASPIVWGDRTYVLTAVKTEREAGEKKPSMENHATLDRMQPGERPRRGGRGRRRGRRQRATPTHIHKFAIMAFERATGKLAWEKTLVEELPHESLHPDSTQASNSPITDGQHLYAYFGSRGLHCLDMKGEVKWSKDFGQMRTRRSFGEGSSPALHGDTIVVNWDHEDDSFIVALDKQTGKEKWRVARDEPTSWSTPIIIDHAGQPTVVAAATNFVTCYDLETGSLRWKCSGLTSNVISTPIFSQGIVYAMSGHRGSAALAIRHAGAKGDVTGSKAVIWDHEGGTPYVPSPMLYDDALYFTQRTNGILSCLNAKTGKPHYAKQRMEGIEGIYASPVGAKDRVYIAGRNGATLVLKHGPKYEVLATNTLDDSFDATPAIAGKELYLRGRKHLYCLAAD